MLSIGSVKSAGGASKYYGSDDYYVSGEADKPGLEWNGSGSAIAGLEGRADTRDFREVLQGTHAAFGDGEKGEGDKELGDGEGKSSKGEENKRPGWDFTFSAPKSVSVAILAGGDKALDRAHNKANTEAMAYMEKHFSVTRVREKGTVVHRITGNLVYGSVVHGTSRAGDPDRHTHNVVANKTFDAETGKWRALETQQAYKYQQLLGMIYQGRMAKEGMDAGHNFKRGHAVGTFELAAWSKDEMRVFSQRREQIEKAIAADQAKTGNAPSPARIEKLVLRGRPEKENIQRSVLVQRWNETAVKKRHRCRQDRRRGRPPHRRQRPHPDPGGLGQTGQPPDKSPQRGIRQARGRQAGRPICGDRAGVAARWPSARRRVFRGPPP
jgi:conjugative relaxase-like TrwC/TraI family protein